MLAHVVRFLAQGVTVDPNDIGLPRVTDTSGALETGLQWIFGVIGAVTLIYIIVAALKLVISQGDPQAVAKTRQGIIYASIGLVIAISAQLIVTFVLDRL